MNRALASFVFTGETLYNLQAAADDVKPPEPATRKTPVKGTLVLTETLEEADNDLLLKIMGAVNLTFNDMDIVVRARLSEYDLSVLHPVSRVVLFGDFAQTLHLSANPAKYLPIRHNGKTILPADPLNIIGLNAANEKRKLWTALKEMFS